MKVERILYVLLILIALLSSAYGYVSGLFTPHHYYEVHNALNSCDRPSHIYINEREDYLLEMRTVEPDDLNFIRNTKTITSKYKKIFEDDLHEMYRMEMENLPVISTLRRNKIDNSFLEEQIFPADFLADIDPTFRSKEKITVLHKTCKVTKQFLQRN
tara:strand:- start:82 stop:555 length:474 start_codon:yes stop_codon:yes gene_type:complete